MAENEGKKNMKVVVRGGSPDTVYTMGVVGACMYYFKGASTPQEKVKAFGKALIWPVTLVAEALKFFLDKKE